MATVEQYHARIEEIDNDISKLQNQVTSLRAKASSYQTTAVEWRNNKGNRSDGSCGGLKKAREACEADAIWKESKAVALDKAASNALSQASAIENNEIPALRTERATNTEQIQSQQASSEEVARELSLQGFTLEGVTNRLTLQGEGEKAAETETGKATGAAILKKAETAASNKKKLAMIGVAVGVVLVVIGALMAWKKFKKLKKAK